MNRTMAKTRSSTQAPKETVHICAERPLQTSLLRYLICDGWFETDGAVALAQLSLTRLRQEDAFLEHGVDQVRPLGLRTVADAINVHQATVSRVTSNKYMLTPREVFELRYFFTVASASSQGGDARSPEAVRHRIKAIIADDAQDDVLSDDDIVVRPKERAVDLRTPPSQNVAKR